MPPKSNVPVRIGGSRRRTGCRTCKQRHIRCDEAQPACINCRRGDRQCTYEFLQPWSRGSNDVAAEVACHRQSSLQWTRLGLSAHVSPHGVLEGFETRALHHFVTFVGKELAGSFSDSVWCDILPRAAQHESSIRHGIIAISTLDMALRRDNAAESERADPLAIMHYTRAIRELNHRLGEANDALCKDVILMSCILFAVFECLQGHYPSALKHISAGMKLLVEWGGTRARRERCPSGGYLDRTALQSVFLTLDSQAIQLGAVGFRDMFAGPALDDQLQTPKIFSTVEDASIALNHIFHRLSHWSNWVEPPFDDRPDMALISLEEQNIQKHLDEWDTAFQTSLELRRDDPTCLLLLTQRKVIQVYFRKHADGPSEIGWDKYLPFFEDAVNCAEGYMELVTRGSSFSAAASAEVIPFGEPRLKLTIAMDIVLPLYLVATRCRDPRLRRRALRMLRAARRKEGIWDSHKLAQMTEKLIHIEESRADEDGFIPEDARMFTIDVLLTEDNTTKLVPRSLVQLPDGKSITEVLTDDEWL